MRTVINLCAFFLCSSFFLSYTKPRSQRPSRPSTQTKKEYNGSSDSVQGNTQIIYSSANFPKGNSQIVVLGTLTNNMMQLSQPNNQSPNIIKSKFLTSPSCHLILFHGIFSCRRTNWREE